MTDKELKRLSRRELVDIMTGQYVRQLSRQGLVKRISSSGKKEGAAYAQGE